MSALASTHSSILSLFTLLLFIAIVMPLSKVNSFIVPGELGLRASGPYREYLASTVQHLFMSADDLKSSRRRHRPRAQWFRSQRVDHFDAQNRYRFSQRYFYNKAYWRSGGPVFVYIGGESALSPYSVVYGHHVELAKQHQALIIAVEHRYYGLSIPTPDLSTSNLKHLSSQQALADLTVFIHHIRKRFGFKPETNALITFGGSYPGALSAWFRRKYPDMVYAAVASSAPIHAKLDFDMYLHGTTKSLGNPHVGGSQECVDQIQAAFNEIELALSNSNPSFLAKKFNSCHTIKSEDDKKSFLASLANVYEGAVQYNDQVPLNIRKICYIMQDSRFGEEPIDRLATLSKKARAKKSKGRCHDFRYSSMLKALRKTKRNPHSGSRQWIYQTCSQLGFYQTCKKSSQCIFSTRIDLPHELRLCRKLFGDSFTPAAIAENVQFTNSFYGGIFPRASRILFVNGVIDPWHNLSVLHEHGKDEHAIFIQGISHCQDMHAAKHSDSEYLKEGRRRIRREVSQWIHDFKQGTEHTHKTMEKVT